MVWCWYCDRFQVSRQRKSVTRDDLAEMKRMTGRCTGHADSNRLRERRKTCLEKRGENNGLPPSSYVKQTRGICALGKTWFQSPQRSSFCNICKVHMPHPLAFTSGPTVDGLVRAAWPTVFTSLGRLGCAVSSCPRARRNYCYTKPRWRHGPIADRQPREPHGSETRIW